MFARPRGSVFADASTASRGRDQDGRSRAFSEALAPESRSPAKSRSLAKSRSTSRGRRSRRGNSGSPARHPEARYADPVDCSRRSRGSISGLDRLHRHATLNSRKSHLRNSRPAWRPGRHQPQDEVVPIKITRIASSEASSPPQSPSFR